jgi:hypothetical protein
MIRKLRASLRKRGIMGTLRTTASYYIVPTMVIPGRIAKRLADRWWDFRHGVETSALVALDRLDINAPTSTSSLRYQLTSAHEFHKAIRGLAIRHDEFVFIDFGCGKGK